jgi:DNA-binding GntR family transcriptional regulator
MYRAQDVRRFSTQDRPVILTKTDMAYWQVRQEILDGTLAPGTSLDQEALAIRLGLSTTPVREALRRLESERLVVGRAHRDTFVAELSQEVLADTYAVRMNLDPLGVSLAAKFATPEDLEFISALAREQPADDPAAHLQHNRALHQAIYYSCGNDVLSEILDLLWDRSDRYRLIMIKEEREPQKLRSEHVEIADAVAARNAKLAAKLMTAHIGKSYELIRQALGRGQTVTSPASRDARPSNSAAARR